MSKELGDSLLTTCWDALLEQAATLEGRDTPALMEFIEKLAAANLRRNDADLILRQIKATTGLGLTVLRAEYSKARGRARDRIWLENLRVKCEAIEEEERERNKPLVYANLVPWTPVRLSQCGVQWVVICCPFCGKQHYHGAPRGHSSPPGDAGGRACHCRVGRLRGEYRLWWDGVSIEPDRKPRRGKQRARA